MFNSRIKKYSFILLINILSFSQLFSQEIKKGEVYSYARKIVDTMASESMHGRGYVNDGDKIAANYILTEFQKFGLRSFSQNYYQKFSFPINTLPGKMEVQIGNQKLIPGKNFIVGSLASENFKIKKRIHYRNKIKHDTSLNFDDFFICDTIGDESYPIRSTDNAVKFSALIVDKLTFSIHGTKENNGIHLLIKRNSIIGFPRKIKLNIESKFIPKYESQNVIGYIPGSTYPDSFIVYSAHYDHLGQMGKNVYFPGANDNASGCA
ncbi:MAG: M28 family peptidase, partial [Bacteroidetes bacterium]|nr:M28 family peptidase [Bacteroidota bacterium]